jgi:hypothetical protein
MIVSSRNNRMQLKNAKELQAMFTSFTGASVKEIKLPVIKATRYGGGECTIVVGSADYWLTFKVDKIDSGIKAGVVISANFDTEEVTLIEGESVAVEAAAPETPRRPCGQRVVNP